MATGPPSITIHIYIYISNLCIEIFAIIIQEDSDIKGIWINKSEHKLSQIADDKCTTDELVMERRKKEKKKNPLKNQ